MDQPMFNLPVNFLHPGQAVAHQDMGEDVLSSTRGNGRGGWPIITVTHDIHHANWKRSQSVSICPDLVPGVIARLAENLLGENWLEVLTKEFGND
jgi:hypothetical protein